MAASITETIQRMGVVIIVVPLVLAGADMVLFGGRTTMGAILLAMAALIWIVSEYVTTPEDVLGSVAKRVAGRVVKSPDEED